MEVGILTWYKELNHGAILQAYASQQLLKRYGYDTYFVDYIRRIENNLGFFATFKKRVIRLVKGDYKYSLLYSDFKEKKSDLFSSFNSNYIDGLRDLSYHHKCLMIGSDMVFSLIQGYSPYMFGNGLSADYIFSYAACSGGTSIELIKKLKIENDIREGLSRFQSIGCRDEQTIEFVKNILPNSNPILTIDPVLLYGFENEIETWTSKKWKEHDPYIVIYSYHGDMNDLKEKNAINKFANLYNYRVVSIGYFHPWCDECINCDAREFFDIIYHARAVITDTFHGTVFSIICKKEFVSFIRGNGFKLEYLLKSCGLENRIVHKVKEIAKVFEDKTNYAQCDQWLKTEREKSGNYILSNVKAAIEVSSYKQEEDLVN